MIINFIFGCYSEQNKQNSANKCKYIKNIKIRYNYTKLHNFQVPITIKKTNFSFTIFYSTLKNNFTTAAFNNSI